MLRPLGRLPLRLRVLLHCFPLFLGFRFLLLIRRLLGLASTVRAGEDLGLSWYRARKTQGDQQYESRNSSHMALAKNILSAILIRTLRPSCPNPLRKRYTSNARRPFRALMRF